MRKRKRIRRHHAVIHAAESASGAIIAMSAPVQITAGVVDGEKKGPPKFTVTAYTGGVLRGALVLGDEHEDVVIDLAGLNRGNSLVANLDHERKQRVGNVSEVGNNGRELLLAGLASAATAARDEVINSAKDGFVWQASVEATPTKLQQLRSGESAVVNGQTFEGPLFIARESTLKGFAFVSHGADDNTIVSIAASAASSKGTPMKAEVKAWFQKLAPSVDVSKLTSEEVANIEADYVGREGKRIKTEDKPADIFAERKAERDRRDQLQEIAAKFADMRPHDIEGIEKMHEHAVNAGMSPKDFRMELLEATLPEAHTVFQPRNRDARLNPRVIEAAICVTGRLRDVEKQFDDQTLQAAHDRFRHGIGLKELFVVAAEANGHRNSGFNVTIETQRAAFGMTGRQQIQAFGFSTISLPSTLTNVANKFIRDGWMSVDQTALRIAAITPVNDFKQRTTVSLTGGLMFEKVGKDGEIKHGDLGEEVYTNQAETFARMLAITRQDMINDDLGALTRIPRRLGRGAMLKLNDIFWTEFLDNSAFFTSGNGNVSTGAGSALGLAGLGAAEAKFRNMTDPDGYPMGGMPAILLVPPTLYASGATLMNSQLLISGNTTAAGNANIWQGRFRLESSPYMENSAYTGNSTAAWYLLANPDDVPVIEIVALNGRVEPQIDNADADFHVLGVQFRGYSDVGVALQEPRGGVRSAGS